MRTTTLPPLLLLLTLLLASGAPRGAEAGKKNAPRAAAVMEAAEDASEAPEPLSASEVMGSMATQGILSASSRAETVEAEVERVTTAEPAAGGNTAFNKYDDKLQKEIESDLGKNSGSLAGAINADGGDMGSFGGIPDGEDASAEGLDSWQDHDISDLHHGVAFGVAVTLCLLFSGWVVGNFLTIRAEAGWANLPRVTLSDGARRLINSVDKEFKV